MNVIADESQNDLFCDGLIAGGNAALSGDLNEHLVLIADVHFSTDWLDGYVCGYWSIKGN